MYSTFKNKPRKPLKRVGFKKKIGTPLKRSGFKPKSIADRVFPTFPTERTSFYTKPRKAMRKRSTTPFAKAERALWKVFSLYIKIRDGWRCFTCGNRATGRLMHAGHFIRDAVGGVLLRYHERNVHAQCEHCNITLDGNQEVYKRKMIATYGEDFVAELEMLKHKTEHDFDYRVKTEYYKDEVEKMRLFGPLSFTESIGH